MAFDYEEIFAGVRCAAAPIFNYTGGLVATLGCAAATVRITEDFSARLTREVRATAAKISLLLGGPQREFAPLSRPMLREAL